jgi:hypothetical protein
MSVTQSILNAAAVASMTAIQKVISLEKSFLTKSIKQQDKTAALFFNSYHQEDFVNSLQLAEKIYTRDQEAEVKAFWLHMICVVTEKTYDLKARQVWMQEWDNLLLEAQSDYILSAKVYHQAVTCYFESHLREAFSKFKQIKDNTNVTMRFRALALLHLGLIHLLKNSSRLALIEFKEALNIAQQIGHVQLEKRLQNEIFILMEPKLHLLHQDTREALLQRNLKSARSAYLAQRRLEIEKGLLRQVKSTHALLPALLLLQGQLKKSLRMLKYITDPAVKVQTLALMKELTSDHAGLSYLEQQIKDELGLETLSDDARTGEACILGLNLNQIEIQDVAVFAKLLYSSKTVNKEEICKTVFEIPYDPVLHDGRIYKLIHKFRNYFGKKDIVVNYYGSYEINPKYRPSAS